MELTHRIGVARHGVVVAVTSHYSSQPFASLGYGLMPTLLQFVFNKLKFRPHPLLDRDAPQHETSDTVLSADMRKAQEVKRFRLSETSRFASFGSEPPELHKTSLLSCQFQCELRESFTEFTQELLCITFVLEANDVIITKTHDDHVTMCLVLSPSLSP